MLQSAKPFLFASFLLCVPLLSANAAEREDVRKVCRRKHFCPALARRRAGQSVWQNPSQRAAENTGELGPRRSHRQSPRFNSGQPSRFDAHTDKVHTGRNVLLGCNPWRVGRRLASNTHAGVRRP
jgi:hypothetical protein